MLNANELREGRRNDKQKKKQQKNKTFPIFPSRMVDFSLYEIYFLLLWSKVIHLNITCDVRGWEGESISISTLEMSPS